MKADIDKKIEDKQLEIENVMEMWAKEVAKAAVEPDFDEFSKKADKFFKKVAEKYAPTLHALHTDLESLEKEKTKSTIK